MTQRSSQQVFDHFVEQAVKNAHDPEFLRRASLEMISSLSPKDYLRFMLDFMYQTQFSKNGITGLLCVPFTSGDDGHDYPNDPFLIGSPGPLDDLDMMEIAAASISHYIKSHGQVD